MTTVSLRRDHGDISLKIIRVNVVAVNLIILFVAREVGQDNVFLFSVCLCDRCSLSELAGSIDVR